jgi:hypothetical protein
VEDRLAFDFRTFEDRLRMVGAEVVARVRDRPAEREAVLGVELLARLLEIGDRTLRGARRVELRDLEARAEREPLDLDTDLRLEDRVFGPSGDAWATGTT